MIPTTSTLALSATAVLAFVTICNADVYSTNPTADTRWVIGQPAQVKWKLTPPTGKTNRATIYLVGGDYTAYKRLETLAKDVDLGEHKIQIQKVPNVTCGASCAIEFLVGGQGDYYSHNFTIAATASAAVVSSNIVADKAAPIIPAGAGSVAGGSASTPSGPITLVQNAAKGAANSNPSSSAASSSTFASHSLLSPMNLYPTVIIAGAALALSALSMAVFF